MTEETPMQPGSVPIAELEELIEYNREQASLCADEERGIIHGSDYAKGVSAALEKTADELEKLTEEHKHD